MPKVAYSKLEREQVREALITTGLELMASQGIRHTAVEQVCKRVEISKTFFYSFFPAKEDLVLQVLYSQQPKLVAHAQRLMDALGWREGVKQFLHDCCYSRRSGFVILDVEEQQALYQCLSRENYQAFQERQANVFAEIWGIFGIRLSREKVKFFSNLGLSMMIVRQAIPDTLPLLFPEVADEVASFQIDSIVDCLEKFKK